jgi:hypothetical protein
VQSFDDCYTWWKSAPLRAGTNLESLSGPLQPGVRFFHHPLPAPPTASLTGCLPPSDLLKGWAEGRAYHVLCDTDAVSSTATSRLGSVFPSVVQRRRIPTAYGNSQPHTVWLRPTAAWAFHSLQGFSRQFTLCYPCGNHLVPRPPCCWQSLSASLARIRYRRSEGTLSSRLHTPPLPATHA